jgi:hypothetical protein
VRQIHSDGIQGQSGGLLPTLTREDVKESDNDRIITFRVMSNIPVIVWDPISQCRKVVSMRWGWPNPRDWKIPQPIHARAESIDDPKKPFARCVTTGQRGIVLVRTFEAPMCPARRSNTPSRGAMPTSSASR